MFTIPYEGYQQRLDSVSKPSPRGTASEKNRTFYATYLFDSSKEAHQMSSHLLSSPSLLSLAYRIPPCMTCRRLEEQRAALPRSRALFNAGRSMEARIAIIAMTMSSSIRVK